MTSPARVAIYYAPTPDDPLSSRSAAWLGRDPATNAPVSHPNLNGLSSAKMSEITAEPRTYGFHATLKPPMRLTEGTSWTGLLTAIRTLAATIAPFDLPDLEVADIHGFLALRETTACPALQALADACVAQPDAFRAPPTEAELARRRKANLTPEQDAMLVRWGYPYVFGTWFFHMTLTRRLSDTEKSIIRPAAEAWFAPVRATPRRVQDICLFTQATPDAAFTLAERIKLRG